MKLGLLLASDFSKTETQTQQIIQLQLQLHEKVNTYFNPVTRHSPARLLSFAKSGADAELLPNY